jgi:hypothetical protein
LSVRLELLALTTLALIRPLPLLSLADLAALTSSEAGGLMGGGGGSGVRMRPTARAATSDS